MKIVFFSLFMFVLTSCQLVPSTTVTPTMNAFDEAFKVNDNCPHICWLGINPGVTTEAEAKKLVSNSKKFDQTQSYASDTGIRTYWFSGKWSIVTVAFDDGLVEQLSFEDLPYSIGNFINILGEPEKINIARSIAFENSPEHIEYRVYYLSRKIIIEVSSGSDNGPSPEDRIKLLMLNVDADAADIPFWLSDGNKDRQEWLGYGHLKDYLPIQTMP